MQPSQEKPKKKRGRKSKKELQALKREQEKNEKLESKKQKKPQKKRGRKPKGGKIIKSLNDMIQSNVEVKQNIILHLKCSSKDLDTDVFMSDIAYDPNISIVQPYQDNTANYYELQQSSANNVANTVVNAVANQVANTVTNACENINAQNIPVFNRDVTEPTTNNTCEDNVNYCNKGNCNANDDISNKELWRKIRDLQTRLINDNVSDKKSACFWCTYTFDNPPIFIPKQQINDTYEVYGCFCTPECSAAYLCNENIDSSTKWERYSLLNSIYGHIFNYNKNIKPAPNPHYLLSKFYGNMSIVEYRKLLTNNKLLLVVDKPITRILPEIHEENDEYDINIGVNNKNVTKKNKYKLKRNKPLINKNTKGIFR